MAGFKIPTIPPATNKTIRFPNDLVQDVESLIANTDCTFSAFVIAAVRAAVDDVKKQEKLSSVKGGVPCWQYAAFILLAKSSYSCCSNSLKSI